MFQLERISWNGEFLISWPCLINHSPNAFFRYVQQGLRSWQVINMKWAVDFATTQIAEFFPDLL